MKMTHRVINRRLAIIAGVVEGEGLNYTTTKLVMSGGRTVASIRGNGWSSLEFYVEDYAINSYQMNPTGMTIEGLREGIKNFEVVLNAFSRCVKLINEMEALQCDWFSVDVQPVVSDADRHLLKSAVTDPTLDGLSWGSYWLSDSDCHLVIRELLKAGYSVTLPGYSVMLPAGYSVRIPVEHGKLTTAEFTELQAQWAER